ncbi:MAG TPA: PfkB family carbohydrate kinase [Candidatus Limnocylindria bacterium]|nr:PfkB family carbohydrate kinase [Candidatus Limnocylindria bacterium]
MTPRVPGGEGGPEGYDETRRRPIVLVVGAASRDLTDDDSRGWHLGGAVTYGSLFLARLGFRVRAVVGVDAEAAGARELADLEAAGAVLVRAPLASGPVFDNVETPEGRRQRCIASSDPIPVTALPRAWTTGSYAVFLAPVASELGDDWAGIASLTVVALGWQGLLRELRAGAEVQRVAPRASVLLSAANLVGVSREDLAPGTDPEALLRLLAPTVSLLVTAGLEGGTAFSRAADGSIFREPYDAIPSDATADPTGAGDVFLAAMLACRLDPALEDPVLFAAAAASLVVEGPGVDGVPDLAAVRRRMTRPPSRASRPPSDVSSRASGRPSQA